MIDVTLYEFKKRENSTLRPDTSVTQKTHTCQLKDKTSLLNPVLFFDFGKKGNPAYYNYCYIEELGNRYYFINDWSYDRGLWVADCSVDVLASWKISIGNSTQYVTRSSYTYNGAIVDSLYPLQSGETFLYSSADGWESADLTTGRYVVGIINNSDTAVGAVSYYVFTWAQFRAFCEYLMGNIDWCGDITEIGADLFKALFNPFQYVVSCNFFPTAPAGDSVSSIPFGWWNLPVSASKLKTSGVAPSAVILDVPKHPQAASRGKYLNTSPFSNYLFDSKVFGTFPLNSVELVDADSLTMAMRVDYVTGYADMFLGVTGQPGYIAVRRGQYGVSIQLAQISRDFFAQATATASGIGSIFSGAVKGLATGNFSNVFGGIESVVKADLPDFSTNGTNGTLLNFATAPCITARFLNPVSEDNADLGRPLCQAKTISSVPGYIEVLHADVALTATASENQCIKTYMERGFFYE